MPSKKLTFSYTIRYSGNTTHSDCLPMLIALHGDGDTVDNFYETVLNELNVRARIILFKGPILHECGRVWPYSPSQYVEYGKAFCEAVSQLTVKYSTVNQPILLGFSGGGAMAYYQAVKYGDSYSYIFPISGLLTKEQLGKGRFKSNTQVYAYHGKDDVVIPLSMGKKAVNLLKKNKICVTFIEFESGHLGLFTDMKSEITQAIENKLNNLYKHD